MHIDTVGRTFAPVTLVPEERLAVAAYARALGIDDPGLRRSRAARDAGLAGRPVPPAMLGFFLVVDADQLTSELGFTWGRTLNAGIDVASFLPVTEGEELEGTAVVEDAWEKPGRDGAARQFLVVRTDFHVEGDLACRWRVTFIERQDRAADPAAPSEPTRTAGDDLVGSVHGTGRLAPGEELPGARLGPVDRLQLSRLSVALDNPDPLHLDDEVARAAGFDQVIGQGSAIVGLLLEPLRRAGCGHAPFDARTRQRAPFTLGDTLTSGGQVTSVDAAVATVSTRVVNQRDEVVAMADITVPLAATVADEVTASRSRR